jgi:hypothetical protein
MFRYIFVYFCSQRLHFSFSTHKQSILSHFIQKTALLCFPKPYTLAGFEPGSSCSWGGCDAHCATPPGLHAYIYVCIPIDTYIYFNCDRIFFSIVSPQCFKSHSIWHWTNGLAKELTLKYRLWELTTFTKQRDPDWFFTDFVLESKSFFRLFRGVNELQLNTLTTP